MCRTTLETGLPSRCRSGRCRTASLLARSCSVLRFIDGAESSASAFRLAEWLVETVEDLEIQVVGDGSMNLRPCLDSSGGEHLGGERELMSTRIPVKWTLNESPPECKPIPPAPVELRAPGSHAARENSW